MNKNICEFSYYDKYGNIICKGSSTYCLYSRYCTQDSTWWASDEYVKCQRRQNMSNKKNKIYKDDKANVSPETEVKKIINNETVVEEDIKEDNITSVIVEDNKKDTSKLWKIFEKGPKTTLIGRGTESKIIGPVSQEVGEYIEIWRK